MSLVPKLAEKSPLHDAETEVTTSTDLARQHLARARAGLDELETAMGPLGTTAESLAQVSRDLADLVINTATAITRSGLAGRAFLPLVEQLAGLAQTSLTAVHDLRRAAGDGRTRVRNLAALAAHSQAALDRLGPALGTLTSAAAQATRTRAPAVEVVVSLGDKSARVAALTEEVLLLHKQRPSGPKN
jgi:hypothetical protein